ncbi:MAG: DUF2239 family protein [Pseudohongiellaceae bacterium]
MVGIFRQLLEADRNETAAQIHQLTDAYRKESSEIDRKEHAQDARNRFMYTMVRNSPRFKEAVRALYAGNGASFREENRDCPEDIRDCKLNFAGPYLNKPATILSLFFVKIYQCNRAVKINLYLGLVKLSLAKS